MNNMHDVSEDVIKNVIEYFSKELPQYSVESIKRKSAYEADDHLYMVIAKNRNYPEIKRRYGGEYVLWTCWNNKTLSLNYGHYDIKTYEDALNMAKEFFYE